MERALCVSILCWSGRVCHVWMRVWRRTHCVCVWWWGGVMRVVADVIALCATSYMVTEPS